MTDVRPETHNPFSRAINALLKLFLRVQLINWKRAKVVLEFNRSAARPCPGRIWSLLPAAFGLFTNRQPNSGQWWSHCQWQSTKGDLLEEVLLAATFQSTEFHPTWVDKRCRVWNGRHSVLSWLQVTATWPMAMWHIHTPGKITTKLSVHRFDHQETGGDLEGARVPPDWRDWCWCTVSKHRYPLSLEEGQRPCSLATCHQHGNAPLWARHWRKPNISSALSQWLWIKVHNTSNNTVFAYKPHSSNADDAEK